MYVPIEARLKFKSISLQHNSTETYVTLAAPLFI